MGKIIDSHDEGSLLKLKVKVVRLDAVVARDFKQEFEAVWESSFTAIEIDMESTEFIDSSGIGALLSIHKKLPASGAGVKLCKVKSPVQTVIELLRLHRIFEISPA